MNPIVKMRRLLEADLFVYYNASEENITVYPYETCGVEYYLDLLYKYYIPVMIFVGLIGNFLSCLVFLTTYLNMRSSSYYLAALAIADIAYLLVLTMDSFSSTLLPDLYNKDGWCQAMTYIGTVASTLSVWLIVAFTVERLIAIQYPLKRPLMCTVSRAKVIVIVLSTIAIVFHTYIFWTAGIDKNECGMLPEHFAAMNIINVLDSIFSLIIPFTLIVMMNVMIARSLFTFNRNMGDCAGEDGLSLEKSVDSKNSTKYDTKTILNEDGQTPTLALLHSENRGTCFLEAYRLSARRGAQPTRTTTTGAWSKCGPKNVETDNANRERRKQI